MKVNGGFLKENNKETYLLKGHGVYFIIGILKMINIENLNKANSFKTEEILAF